MELAVTFANLEIPSLINSLKRLDGHINLFVCVCDSSRVMSDEILEHLAEI